MTAGKPSAPGSIATSPQVVRRAAALLIGGELLSAKIADQNLRPLAQTLKSLGVVLDRVLVLPDDVDVISEELARLRQRVDVVFTSGGVGPTHDDLTVEAVAASLGVTVDTHPELLTILEEVYGDEMSDAHKLMARAPTGAVLRYGGDMRWPAIVAENVWILPGVPELFRAKLAIIRDHLRGPAEISSEEVLTTQDELAIKTLLDQLVAAHPEVEIGSYPKWFDERYKTRVTFDGRSQKAVSSAATALRQQLGDTVVRVSSSTPSTTS